MGTSAGSSVDDGDDSGPELSGALDDDVVVSPAHSVEAPEVVVGPSGDVPVGPVVPGETPGSGGAAADVGGFAVGGAGAVDVAGGTVGEGAGAVDPGTVVAGAVVAGAVDEPPVSGGIGIGRGSGGSVGSAMPPSALKELLPRSAGSLDRAVRMLSGTPRCRSTGAAEADPLAWRRGRGGSC